MGGKNQSESGGDTALDFFLKIGLDERTAKNTVANNKVTANLTAVIHEAAVENGCDRTIGNLLYTVSTKFPTNALVHRPALLKYITSSKIKTPAQLDAAFSFLSDIASGNLKVDDFEAAYGVVLDSVATISYELSKAKYAENEVNDPWVQRLLHAVEISVAWFQPLMTSTNYDTFVHLVIDFIVKRLEVIMNS